MQPTEYPDNLEKPTVSSPTCTALLCCPFCGSNCVNDTTPPEESLEEGYFWVCPCCVSCGPVGTSIKEATDLWNKRAS